MVVDLKIQLGTLKPTSLPRVSLGLHTPVGPMAVTAAASSVGCVEQPAVYLPLKELTDRSARLAKLKLAVYQPWEDTYKYTWQNKEVTGNTFKCLLVDIDDPECYCHAEFKKSVRTVMAYNAALKKYTEGARFVFKDIAFAKDSKAAYLSAPKRGVVNLQNTSAEAIHGSLDASAVQPCPTGTVAEKLELRLNQRFDITVLLKTVSALRDCGSGRQCFDVELIDGSTNKDKLQTMQVTLFKNEQSAPEFHASARDWMTAKEPVTFLQLQGSKSPEEEFCFRSAWSGWLMVRASAEQPGAGKVSVLTKNAEAWLADKNTEAFVQKKFEHRDFSQDKGTETTVKLFLTLPRFNSGIADLDEEESFWQVNWARMHEPAQGQEIHTADGKRLWFPVTFRDSTNQHTLFIRESAALQLAGLNSAEEFRKAHAAGRLWFPPICSLKILRKRSAAQPAADLASQPENANDYDALIVEATEQDLKQAPTTKSLHLLNMLAARMDAVDVFLPATLQMIRKSPHYSICVHYDAQELHPEIAEDLRRDARQLVRSCTQAFALIEATAGGEIQQLGDQGYKLVTKGVKDPFAGAEQPANYTITAFCTLESLQDFKLDPPRGSKSQYAIIIISDVMPGATEKDPHNFMVDSILLLHRDDVGEIKDAMQKLLYYVAAASEINERKDKREWDNDFSPAKAQKCRRLSAHPTGEVLPKYQYKC